MVRLKLPAALWISSALLVSVWTTSAWNGHEDGTATGQSAPVPGRFKIAILGDSYAAGTGATPNRTWDGLPSDDVDDPPSGYGPEGCERRTTSWAHQYAEALRREQPHLYVELVNLACHGAETVNVRTKQIANASAPERQIVTTEPPPIRGIDESQGDRADLILKAGGCPKPADDRQIIAIRVTVLSPAGQESYAKTSYKCHYELESPINLLDADTDLVLMSIGGNDLGFGQIVEQCFSPFHADEETCESLAADASASMASLGTSTTSLLDEIHERLERRTDGKPAGRIVLLDYPHIERDIDYQLGDFAAGRVLRGLANTLTETQSQSVGRLADARKGRTVFLGEESPMSIRSQFEGREPAAGHWGTGGLLMHEFVGRGDYELRVDSYHPNRDGHAAITNVLLNYTSEGGEGGPGVTGRLGFHPRNSVFSLSSPAATPPPGSPTDQYTFEVVYQDPEGERPSIKTLYLDGLPQPVSPTVDGDKYSFGPLTLTTGDHVFYFIFENSDGPVQSSSGNVRVVESPPAKTGRDVSLRSVAEKGTTSPGGTVTVTAAVDNVGTQSETVDLVWRLFDSAGSQFGNSKQRRVQVGPGRSTGELSESLPVGGSGLYRVEVEAIVPVDDDLRDNFSTFAADVREFVKVDQFYVRDAQGEKNHFSPSPDGNGGITVGDIFSAQSNGFFSATGASGKFEKLRLGSVETKFENGRYFFLLTGFSRKTIAEFIHGRMATSPYHYDPPDITVAQGETVRWWGRADRGEVEAPYKLVGGGDADRIASYITDSGTSNGRVLRQFDVSSDAPTGNVPVWLLDQLTEDQHYYATKRNFKIVPGHDAVVDGFTVSPHTAAQVGDVLEWTVSLRSDSHRERIRLTVTAESSGGVIPIGAQTHDVLGTLAVTGKWDTQAVPPGTYALTVRAAIGDPNRKRGVDIHPDNNVKLVPIVLSAPGADAVVAPALLAPTFPGTEVVRLSWSPGERWTSGTLERSVDGASWSRVADFSPGESSLDDADVNGGSSYWYRIRVIGGNLEAESVARFVTVPQPPRVSWLAPGEGARLQRGVSLKVAWTSEEVGDRNVRVQFGRQSETLLDVGSARASDDGVTWTVPADVPLGKGYRFFISVPDLDGVIDQSGEIEIVPPQVQVFVTSNLATEFKLSQGDTTRSEICRTPCALEWTKGVKVRVAAGALTGKRVLAWTRLDGTELAGRVDAIEVVLTETLVLTVAYDDEDVTPPARAPGPPVSVRARAGNGSATVSWNAPVDDGGEPITKYIVTASPGGASCEWASGALECRVDGLKNGDPYTFVAVAVNKINPSDPSVASEHVTPVGPPGKSRNVRAERLGAGRIRVWWEAPEANGGAAIDDYTVSSSKRPSPPCRVDVLECTFLGSVGILEQFTVVARNRAGPGDPSEPSEPVGIEPPSPPRNPQATAGNASASVSWEGPGDAGGGTIRGFEVLSTPHSKSCSAETALNCTVKELQNGTAYTFTVRAKNEAELDPIPWTD